MPNTPRQFGVSQFYHIIKRGVDGRKIFLKNQDYSRFILGLEFFNSDKKIRLWNLIREDYTEHGLTVLNNYFFKGDSDLFGGIVSPGSTVGYNSTLLNICSLRIANQKQPKNQPNPKGRRFFAPQNQG